MPSFRFPKSSRLNLRKEINALFISGNSFNVFPYRIIYQAGSKGPAPVMMAIAVPKKNIRLATNRNRIKRQTREAWRLNNHSLKSCLENKNITLRVLLVYNGKELPEYANLHSKIILILQRLQEVHESIVD